MSKERTPYNFAPETKKEALNLSDHSCDNCDQVDDRTHRLQIHHQIAIWAAREMGIAADVIKSIENTSCLCQECHDSLHHQENRHQYAYLAWHLLGVDVEPKNEKDTWRKDPNHPINKYRKKKKRR